MGICMTKQNQAIDLHSAQWSKQHVKEASPKLWKIHLYLPIPTVSKNAKHLCSSFHTSTTHSSSTSWMSWTQQSDTCPVVTCQRTHLSRPNVTCSMIAAKSSLRNLKMGRDVGMMHQVCQVNTRWSMENNHDHMMSIDKSCTYNVGLFTVYPLVMKQGFDGYQVSQITSNNSGDRVNW